jgi:hypothetical protein
MLVLLCFAVCAALYENAHKKSPLMQAVDTERAKLMEEILRKEYEKRVEQCKEKYEPASAVSPCQIWLLNDDGMCVMTIDFACVDKSFNDKCLLMLAPYAHDPCIELVYDGSESICSIRQVKDCKPHIYRDAANVALRAGSWAGNLLKKIKR